MMYRMHTILSAFIIVLALVAVIIRPTTAIVTNELKSRRAALATSCGILSSSMASVATLTSNPKRANAIDSEERMVVLGTNMKPPLKNVVVDESAASASASASWRKPKLFTQLGKSRIDAQELSPLSPSLVPFAVDNELYYEPFLFGSWDVTSTLKQKIYPYGVQYLPSSSLYEGSPRNRNEKPGDTTQYQLHFFSSTSKYVIESNSSNAKNYSDNNIKEIDVDLHQGTSNLKIIADRSFNAKSLNLAYKQLSQIEDIIWDYKKDPTRLTLQFGTLGEDMQPLGERRGEVYINARKSETAQSADTNEATIFCAAERLRSVLLIPGDVVVSDTETITEYKVVDGSNGNHVKAVSRVAVYLTPNPNSREGLLWQSVGGKAVAFFDYDIDMKRKLLDTNNSKPFVIDSKGFMQVGTY